MISGRRKKALALYMIMMTIRRRRKQRLVFRRYWRAPWNDRRQEQALNCNLLKELEVHAPSYRKYIRMNQCHFQDLVKRVAPAIARMNTKFHEAVSVEERVALTLRFLATGETFASLAFQNRLGASTVGYIVPETAAALYEVLKSEYLKMPSSSNEWIKVAEGFETKWNFPVCIGALDGKHVRIKPPPHSGSTYYNYKSTFSIVLMALVDADYRFLYCDVGCNGRMSDGGVFGECSLNAALQSGIANVPSPIQITGIEERLAYHIVADDAFPLRNDIMKPHKARHLTEEQRIFNYRLSRARRVVENAFGILSNRFRVFLTTIALSPEKVEVLVLAACALHNYLLTKCDKTYLTPGLPDYEDPTTHRINNGQWRQQQQLQSIGLPHSKNPKVAAKHKRDLLTHYFSSPEGSVEWQLDMI